MCQKIGFDTKEEARAHAHYLKAQIKFRSKKQASKKSNKKFKVYLCYCDQWHLTTRKKK